MYIHINSSQTIYNNGYAAYNCFLTSDACPYPFDSVNYYIWMSGFYNAYEEDLKTK